MTHHTCRPGKASNHGVQPTARTRRLTRDVMPNTPVSTMTRLLLLPAVVLLSPLTAFAIFYGEDDYVEIDQIPKGSSKLDWSAIVRSVAIVIPDPGPGAFDLTKLRPMRARSIS